MALILMLVLGACGGSAGESRQDEPVPTSFTTSPLAIVPTPTAESTPTVQVLVADVRATPTSGHMHPTPAQSTATAQPVRESVLVEPAVTATPVEQATATLSEDRLVIVLDPGHDRSSPGALGIEYQVVLRTAFIAREALEAAGYEVHLTREDNDKVFSEYPELLPPNAADMHPGYGAAYAHATKALEFEPDMVILLHYNGHPNPDVRGIEIYYCEMGGSQNLVLAEIVRDELVVALSSMGYETPSTKIAEDLTVARGGRHFPSLGNVYDPPTVWVENRFAGIPVVLTEPLYMTNPIERPMLDDERTHQAIAAAYVRAADRYFGR
jgi:N-acetylmuramoyl-L-alanine amidase